MPMIHSRITGTVSAEKREILKTELGNAVSILNKPQSYLMLDIEDGADLYFAGHRLERGAYVEVKIFGTVNADSSSRMTAKICEIFKSVLDIPGDSIYVSYWGTSNWGYDGSNF